MLGQTSPISYSYTGSLEQFTVPDCVSSITMVVTGADGGNSTNFPVLGGTGASATATFIVTPGDVLDIVVGQAGESSFGSGGGGGGSGVRLNGAGFLVIAGGGGGGSNQFGGQGPGNGGSAVAGSGSGGAGGPAGAGGGGFNSLGANGSFMGGGGAGGAGGASIFGFAFAGGTGGEPGFFENGVDGGFGIGGGGGSGAGGGGGGGGGYTGGNGGGGSNAGGGGTIIDLAGTAKTITAGTDGGSPMTPNNGSVMLSWTVDPEVTPTFAAIDPICMGDDAPALSTNSENGINGTWSPMTINTEETTSYTFTPAAGECAEIGTLEVTVIECIDDMSISVTDPCSCGNPLNLNIADGTTLFEDKLLIDLSGFPAGLVPTITAVDGNLLTSAATAHTAASATAGIVTLGSGMFELQFYTLPGAPATVTVEAGGDTETFTTARCFRCVPIPTMGQWGLIICGLLLLIFGVVSIKSRIPSALLSSVIEN